MSLFPCHYAFVCYCVQLLFLGMELRHETVIQDHTPNLIEIRICDFELAMNADYIFAHQ